MGLPSCGGGSADSGSTASTVVVQQTPPLTKPQFIVQADSICRAANEKGTSGRKLNEIRESASSEDERAQVREVGEVMRQQSEITDVEIEEIRAREPTTADRQTITRMLALVDSEIGPFAIRKVPIPLSAKQE